MTPARFRLCFMLALVGLIYAALATRYTVTPVNGAPYTVRLDRWTGAVQTIRPDGSVIAR